MIGALAFIAMSCSFVIFSAWVSDREPPNTVKSLANTKVLRPFTVPQPVMTPSPGTLVFSMPNSVERCSTNMSNSSNEPLSSSSSMRSRAVNFPRACCASMRFSPPPSLAPARRSSRVSRMSFMLLPPAFWVTIERPSNTAFSEAETPLPASGTAAWCPLYPHPDHGDQNDRCRKRRHHGRRYRGCANAASAGGISALYRDDAALLCLGRRLVDLCHPVFRARSQLCGLPVGTAFRRPHLQRSPQLSRTDGDDDDRICHRLAARALDCDDLAGPYRLRPRARLRPEIRRRLWLYPSGADRPAPELTADWLLAVVHPKAAAGQQ